MADLKTLTVDIAHNLRETVTCKPKIAPIDGIAHVIANGVEHLLRSGAVLSVEEL